MYRNPFSWAVYGGVFGLCLGLLYFEVFFVRILAFVGGAHSIYLTIAFAMLGLAASGSLIAMVRPGHWLVASRSSLVWLASLTSWSVLFALVASRFIKGLVNQGELEAMRSGGLYQLLLQAHDTAFLTICGLGAATCFAYFFFGATLSVLFRQASQREVGRVYAYDLLGAGCGCVAVIFAMELLNFKAAALVGVFLPSVAALLFAAPERRTAARVAVGNLAVLALGSWICFGWIEPEPLVPRLARDYHLTKQSEEQWRAWNSYGRLSGVVIGDPEKGGREVVVHGNGEGHAVIPRSGPPSPVIKLSTVCGRPRRVLVLLAGAGWDLMQLSDHLGAETELIGVELVGDVFEIPLERNSGQIRELLARENVQLVRSEAREYLARDRSRYDVVLVSWAGASLSYYSGAASSAVDFIYTKEALAELLDHLTPQGQLIILNGNKIRHIFALKEIFAERENEKPLRDCLIVTNDHGEEYFGFWWQPWDNQRILIKPGGYTAEEEGRVAALQRIIYGPHSTARAENWYGRAILEDSQALKAELTRKHGVDLSVVTDDRPFILDTFPVGSYFSWDFWSENTEYAIWIIKKRHLQFVLAFSVVSIALILAPLLARRRQSPLDGQTKLSFVAYFFGIGAGFMLFEIALISKLQLLIGHPGYVVAIVLGSIILFTGLGSLCVNPMTDRFSLSTRPIALLAVMAMGGVLVGFEAGKDTLVGLAFWSKCALAFLIPAVPCFLLGFLFPLGMRALKRADGQLASWALAINGVSGTLASGATLVVAQAFGFNAMALLGGLCYLVAALSLREGEGGPQI